MKTKDSKQKSSKKPESLGAVTHTHTHTHGAFYKIGKKESQKKGGNCLRSKSTSKSNAKSTRIQVNNKLFVVILTMVILVGLFTLMLTNSEVRENIRNGLDAFGNNFNSEDSVNEEIDLQADTQVFEDGSAMLTDDSAIVEKVDISNRITGTGPFDDNDEPGNDSSESNNIVRSFDTVTWNLEAITALNRTGHGSEDVNTYSQFRGGVIYVEAKLPEENAGLMKWSLDDMAWAGDTGVLSDDGLTFTGQYEMSDEIITVPGKQTFTLVLKVEGAGNGTKLTPTFKLWMQGNETDSRQ